MIFSYIGYQAKRCVGTLLLSLILFCLFNVFFIHTHIYVSFFITVVNNTRSKFE